MLESWANWPLVSCILRGPENSEGVRRAQNLALMGSPEPEDYDFMPIPAFIALHRCHFVGDSTAIGPVSVQDILGTRPFPG